ncbi:hypothetical protein Pint_23661 [Pistacia integerrima]|uniref:Uncharacterized protein n=1 Tax=Pistacia integerrima TaxID=434235 RepID=A0ACC0YH00_9ROSI|nr:hypothetical protein Pint_23661 [Pistacia integerrima]
MAAVFLFTPTIPTFFIMFSFVYLLAYFLIFCNWDPQQRAGASSCFISLVHGTPAVLIATYALINTQRNFGNLASPNTTSQNIVLEFSIGYFLMDLLHYIIFYPREVLFILHHLVTLYVFVTCRYMVHHGASAILVLLILAEITSPCQNVWTLASFRKAEVPASAKLYKILSPPFYVFYSVVRGVIGPLFVFKMGVFYISGAADSLIPKWAWVSWMVVIISAIALSILWILNNWLDLYKESRNRASKKVR